MDTAEEVQKEAGCLEADASEADKGNTDSLNTANIIDVGSSSPQPLSQPLPQPPQT